MKYPITITVSPGELIDRITIATIKSQRITDPDKRDKVYQDLINLGCSWVRARDPDNIHPNLFVLWDQLKRVNEDLWIIEDAIREKERTETFDNEFIRLARSVYKKNDKRSRLKQEIDKLLGHETGEIKSYAGYRPKEKQKGNL